MNVTAIAQSGLRNAFQRFGESAERVARDGVNADLANEAVEQIVAKQSVGANIAVLRTADEMMGRLLDIKA